MLCFKKENVHEMRLIKTHNVKGVVKASIGSKFKADGSVQPQEYLGISRIEPFHPTQKLGSRGGFTTPF
jgi:hypothetical protein